MLEKGIKINESFDKLSELIQRDKLEKEVLFPEIFLLLRTSFDGIFAFDESKNRRPSKIGIPGVINFFAMNLAS